MTLCVATLCNLLSSLSELQYLRWDGIRISSDFDWRLAEWSNSLEYRLRLRGLLIWLDCCCFAVLLSAPLLFWLWLWLFPEFLDTSSWLLISFSFWSRTLPRLRLDRTEMALVRLRMNIPGVGVFEGSYTVISLQKTKRKEKLPLLPASIMDENSSWYYSGSSFNTDF